MAELASGRQGSSYIKHFIVQRTWSSLFQRSWRSRFAKQTNVPLYPPHRYIRARDRWCDLFREQACFQGGANELPLCLCQKLAGLVGLLCGLDGDVSHNLILWDRKAWFSV
jgi:hypothetical protein